MEPILKKPRIFINICFVRTLGTVISRFLRNIPGATILIKPIRTCRLYNDGVIPHDSPDLKTMDELKLFFDSYFKNTENQDDSKFIYFDLTTEDVDMFKDLGVYLTETYGTKIILVGRHPNYIRDSWNRFYIEVEEAYLKDGKSPLDQGHLEKTKYSYDQFDEVKSKFKSSYYHLSSDLLLDNPEKQIKSLFNFLGLKYDSSYMNWEPYSKTNFSLPTFYKCNPHMQALHGSWLVSTEFRQKTYDPEDAKNKKITPMPDRWKKYELFTNEEEGSKYDKFLNLAMKDQKNFEQ